MTSPTSASPGAVDATTGVSPLAGLKVLELSHYIAAPHCAQVLADHGADVVKVEPPAGDQSRASRPVMNDASIYFAVHNRNKRSLSLDLKSQSAAPVLEALLRWADVLVTNYGAGVPERLGFGWEQASAHNPRLVMVHITGFGLDGPDHDGPAYDGVLQAMSGLAEMTGERDGPPLIPGLFVADHIAAMQGVIGVFTGLASRARDGKGHLVDISMYDAMSTLLAHHVGSVSQLGQTPSRNGSTVPTALADVYPAKDGWVYLSPLTNRMWGALCDLAGWNDWKTTPAFGSGPERTAHRDEIDERLTVWTRDRTRDEIVSQLRSVGVACGPLNSVADVIADAQLEHRQMFPSLPLAGGGTVSVPGRPVKVADAAALRLDAAPALGEHGREVLAELGWTASAIDEIVATGAVGGVSAVIDPER